MWQRNVGDVLQTQLRRKRTDGYGRDSAADSEHYQATRGWLWYFNLWSWSTGGRSFIEIICILDCCNCLIVLLVRAMWYCSDWQVTVIIIIKVKVNICYSAPNRLSHRRGAQIHGAHQAASCIPALNLPSRNNNKFQLRLPVHGTT